MVESKKCPKCDNDLTPVMARCICSKDFCMGQRCGATETVDHYKCMKCKYVSEQTQEGKNYFDKYVNK